MPYRHRRVDPLPGWEQSGTDDDRVLEPWVFLVDADGTIIGSWDNIATHGELASALAALPAP